MNTERWKKASLAISSIIRGLELDQVEFQYDESGCDELPWLKGIVSSTASQPRASALTSERARELRSA